MHKSAQKMHPFYFKKFLGRSHPFVNTQFAPSSNTFGSATGTGETSVVARASSLVTKPRLSLVTDLGTVVNSSSATRCPLISLELGLTADCLQSSTPPVTNSWMAAPPPSLDAVNCTEIVWKMNYVPLR